MWNEAAGRTGGMRRFFGLAEPDGSKMRTRNGSLVKGTKDQHLQSPGGCILTHTRMILAFLGGQSEKLELAIFPSP